MAMLPDSARTAASYLGGGIARGIEQKGAQVAKAGMQAAESAGSGVGQKVGQFLQNIGGQVQQFGSSVGTQGSIKKRDLGLAAAGAAMTGAFVGGMGANAGLNSLIAYQASDPRGRVPVQPGQMGDSPMPADLQTGYIALNQPGSPLGTQQLRLSYDVKAAQDRQQLLRAAMGPEPVYTNTSNK
jgi:hypothetical protein